MKLIRSLIRKIKNFLFLNLPARNTKYNFKFHGPIKRFDSAGDEIGLILIIKALRKYASRFVNIGANAGFFVLLAESYGLECIAFEP